MTFLAFATSGELDNWKRAPFSFETCPKSVFLEGGIASSMTPIEVDPKHLKIQQLANKMRA